MSAPRQYGLREIRSAFVTAVSLNAMAIALVNGIAFVRSVILARLLAPADYGLFSMAALVLSGMTALTGFQFSSNLIYRRLPEGAKRNVTVNTLWTAELFRQALIALAMLLLAFPAAEYFRDARVKSLLMTIALAPVISGFTNVGLILDTRAISFRRVVLHKISSEGGATLLAIIVALLTPNVWALVVSQIGAAVISTGASYLVHPYRPRFCWDTGVLRESMGLSKHLLAVSLLTYITTQADSLIIGRYLGAGILGAYVVAYRLANLPVDLIAETFGPIITATYSKVNLEHDTELGSVFARVYCLLSVLLVSISLILALCAQQIVSLLYGARWLMSASLLQVLAFVGLARGMARLIAPLYLVRDKAVVESTSKAAEALIFITLAVWFVPKYGAIGGAYAALSSYGLAFVTRFAMVFVVLRDNRGAVFGHTCAVAGAAIVAVLVGRSALGAGVAWPVAAMMLECAFLAIAVIGSRKLRIIAWSYVVRLTWMPGAKIVK